MSSKTIDNLGVESSVRYAVDQEILDKSMLMDSSLVSSQAIVEVTAPAFSPSLDAFLGISRISPWAVFYPPYLYNMQKKRIFTSTTIPSIGTEEYMHMQMQRIENQHDLQKDNRKKKKDTERYAWEDERDQRDEDAEMQVLLHLIKQVLILDKNIYEINARRNQYQKG